ncbi:DUF748 domain-containing protein [Marinomonas sp. NPDC078689]|uniref:DUF748 domain-containing protein n=1 Tax=Marinomonas sp. NPDC078689 TaxID=3364147 RepID=UPI0037C9470B
MKKPWRNYLIIPSISLFIVIFVTWLLTPIIGKHYLVKYFAEQGEEASVSSLSVDFFPPKITLKELNVMAGEQQTLALNKLSVGIEVFPLFTKNIHVTDADIDGLILDIKQQKDQWFVAGIDLSQYQQTTPEETTEKAKEEDTDKASPWSINVPRFRFTNSAVHLTRQLAEQSSPTKDTLTINNVAIDDLAGQGLDWQGKLELNALLNSAQFRLSSRFDYNPNTATVDLTLGKNRLPLKDFAHFVPAPYQQGSGVISLDGKLALSILSNAQSSSFSLHKSTLTIRADDLALPLQDKMSVSTKNTTLDLADVSATYNTDNAISASGKVTLSSQDSAFTQDENSTEYQSLDLSSALTLKRQQNINDLKSQQTDIRLQGVNIQQDGNQAQVGKLQLTLDDLVAQAQDDATTLQLTSHLLIKLSDLNAQLPEEQTAAIKSASLALPFEINKTAEGITASTPKSDFSVTGLSLALTSLLLDNDHTGIELSNLSAKQTSDEQVSLALNSKVSSSGLAAQQADNKLAYQTLNWSNSLTATQNKQSIAIQNSQFDLAIGHLDVAKKDTIHSTLGNTQLTAKQLNIDLDGDKAPNLTGTGINLLSNAMDSQLTPEKRAAAWDSANLTNLDITQQGNDFAATLQQFIINNLVVSEPINKGKKQPPLATLSHLEVNQVNANQDGAQIKSVLTKNLVSNVLMDKERRISNLVFIDANQQTPPDATVPKTSAPKEKDANNTLEKTPGAAQDPAFKAPYYVILGAFDLTGTSSVHLEDNGVKPPLKRTLEITKLSLRNLNTKDKKQATTLALEVKNGKYTKLNGDLTIWPLADELTMQSELTVSQAELPPYSPYIANVLGYQIDSGQLNLDLKLDSQQGELSGKSHLVLKQFDLGGTYESGSAIKAGVIPLNIAVGALKDSNNNIDLDIPLSGNIDSPSFGWSDFLFIPVKKALFQASSSYLLQTFVPYANVITVAQFASDQLLKIRVKPLIYQAKETTIEDQQDVFLKQLVALLKDKKQSELKICGIASYVDLGLEQPPATIDDQARHQANLIAEERANHLKDYLVSQDIDSARLFICSPELDFSKKSQPRIELNF